MKKFIAIFLSVILCCLYTPINTKSIAVTEDTLVTSESNPKLWSRFLKYDLRITDYNSLSEEEKDLCKFIFETERSAQDTIICERARRILAGYDVGERITEQFGITFTKDTLEDYETMSKIFENLEKYQNIFDRCISSLDENYNMESRDKYETLKDMAVLNVVPDIRHIDTGIDYNEYWFDDYRTAGIEVMDNSCYYNLHNVPFTFRVYNDDYYLKIERNINTLPTIEYENCTYQICPDNTLAFYSLDDKTISSIDIPETIDGMKVTGIKMLAFENCDIESIHLPETLNYIESLAFYNCNKLCNINFPKGLDSIGEASFSNCKALKDITIDCSNLKFSNSSFYDCSVKNIFINVKTVPEWFTSCFENYKSFTLGSDVKEIGYSLINEDIEIPENINIVTWGIVQDESIIIPKNIEILGAYKEATGRNDYVSATDIPPVIPLLENKSIFKSSNGTIKGYYGTEAHNYALAHNLKFSPLDDLTYGDANNDNTVNIADAVSLNKYILGKGVVGYEADINKDGIIDSFDMILMRNMILNK